MSQHSSQFSLSTSKSQNKLDPYHGVLRVSKLKIIQRTLFDFFTYFYQRSSISKIYLFIMSTWRMILYFFPAFMPESTVLYAEGTGQSSFSKAVAIFIRIVPTSLCSNCYVVVGTIYLVLFVLFYIFIFSSCYIYSKEGYLPEIISSILTYLFRGPWEILHTLMINYSANQIMNYCIGRNEMHNPIVWVVFVLSILFYIAFIVFNYIFVSVCLGYYPTTLSTFSHFFANIFIHITSLLGFIAGIMPFAPSYGRYIIYFFTILLYVGSIVVFFLVGPFTNKFHNMFFFNLTITALCISIANLFYDIFNREVDSVTFVVYTLIFLIMIFGGNYINSHIFKKVISILDNIQDQPEIVNESITNIFYAVFIANYGFTVAHPLLTSWKFFRMIIEQWPYASQIWISWARFVAGYPEDNSLLAWIDEQINHNVFHTRYIMFIRIKIHTILRIREEIMTPALKSRMSSYQKSYLISRNRIKKYWECVLKGNEIEIVSASLSTAPAMDESLNHLHQLLVRWPNNKHVIRLFSKYESIICGDKIEVFDWDIKYRNLRNGTAISTDYIQQCLFDTFPVLKSNVKKNNSINIEDNTVPELPDLSDLTIRQAIKSSIESISFSSIKWSKIMYTVLDVVLLALYIPIFAVTLALILEKSFDKIYITAEVSELSHICADLVSYCLKYVMGKQGIDNTVSISETITEIQRISKAIENSMYKIRELKNADNDQKDYSQIQSLLFENTIEIPQYIFTAGGIFNKTTTKTSIESMALSIVMESANLVNPDTNITEVLIGNSLPNMLYSLEYASHGLNSVFELIRKQIELDLVSINKITIIGSCIGIVIFVLCTIFLIVYMIIAILKDRHAIVRCLLMIPKHQIMEIISSFDETNHKHTNASSASFSGDGSMSRNSDANILSTLSMANLPYWTRYTKLIYACVGQTLLLMIGIILIWFGADRVKQMGEQLVVSAPHSKYFLTAITHLVAAYIFVQRAVMYDAGIRLLGESRSYVINIGIFKTNLGMKMFDDVLFGSVDMDFPPLTYVDENLAQFAFFHEIGSGAKSPVTYYCESASYIPRLLAHSTITAQHVQAFDLENIIFKILEPDFFLKFAADIPNLAKHKFISHRDFTIYMVLVAYIFVVIIFIACFIFINMIKKSYKWMVETFYHVPPMTLIQSNEIMSLINSHYTSGKIMVNKFSEEFFIEISKRIPDGIITTTPDLKIVGVCDDIVKYFPDISIDNIINKPLIDIIQSDALYTHVDNAIAGRCSFMFHETIDQKFDILVLAHTKKGTIQTMNNEKLKYLSFIISDVSEVNQFMKDLKKEKKKVNQLLSVFLPKPIFPLYQEYESTVSFAVHSASVMFIQVTSFSSQAFSTLTSIFNQFDTLADTYNTIYKTKIIGNIYMIVGGVFNDQVIPPETHTRDIVKFGLSCISAVKEMKMSVTIGLNTGGPVMAGILNTESPTFEVYGPPIGTAYKMMKTGTLNRIHITRFVYELVFSANFKIREVSSSTQTSTSDATYFIDVQ